MEKRITRACTASIKDAMTGQDRTKEWIDLRNYRSMLFGLSRDQVIASPQLCRVHMRLQSIEKELGVSHEEKFIFEER